MKEQNNNYQCIGFDLNIESTRCTIVSFNRSPSKSADEFKKKNLFLTVVTGDFNARPSKWWMHDKTS